MKVVYRCIQWKAVKKLLREHKPTKAKRKKYGWKDFPNVTFEEVYTDRKGITYYNVTIEQEVIQCDRKLDIEL